MKFVGSGKVKDIYDMEDGTLLFRFSNRVSAFDVKFKEEIPEKGKVLCRFAEFWFNKLQFSNHFVRRHSDEEIIVKKMRMLPIECIVRGYFYGSIVSRWENDEITLPENTDTTLASKLPEPVFDPTTKSEHDVPTNKEEAIKGGLVSEKQYDLISNQSVEIYKTMARTAETADFILADLKLEFGVLNGDIVLGDSIGPDEYRLWPKKSYRPGKIQEAYDKQLLRDWLIERGYKEQFDRQRENNKEPVPPSLPSELVQKISERYITSFEKLTGEKL